MTQRDSTPGKRIVVVGNTGSGKITFAAELARKLECRHVELDALFWEADWQQAPLDVFRDRVARATRADRWVVDGNYSRVRDIVWPRADTLVWLDYPLPVTLWRVFIRTVGRIFTGERLWNDNREDFRSQFLSADSLLLWAAKSHYPRRRKYAELVNDPASAHLKVVRLRTPRQARKWLNGEDVDT